MKVKNMTSANGNTVKNQFDIIDGTNHTYVSYETTIATAHVASAFIVINEKAFNYSMTTTRHFLNWLENTLCVHKPTRKDVEGWMKNGFIPAAVNVYATNIEIRTVDANILNMEG